MSSVPKYLGLNGRPLGIAITSILTFGFVLVGYDQGMSSKADTTKLRVSHTSCTGVMSGVIQTPLWLENFPAVDHNPNMLGFTVAIYDIGCLLGALWCLLLGDKLGRKKSCILGGLFVIVGVVIQVTSFKKAGDPNGALGQFLIGRVITGAGNGMNMASMPMYQAEVVSEFRSLSCPSSNACLEFWSRIVTLTPKTTIVKRRPWLLGPPGVWFDCNWYKYVYIYSTN